MHLKPWLKVPWMLLFLEINLIRGSQCSLLSIMSTRCLVKCNTVFKPDTCMLIFIYRSKCVRLVVYISTS